MKIKLLKCILFDDHVRVFIDGVTYKSLNQAAKALKIHRKAVQKRLDDIIDFPKDIYLD